MKTVSPISIVILYIFASFVGCKQSNQLSNDIITIDVTKTNYPKKELILQDFMDVEYIPLETSGDFVNQGLVMDIGNKFLLVRNRNEDGNIFVYDRTGKALRKINHKGQGGEEYSNILGIILDEANFEMYVNNHFEAKIQVYDLNGSFKRTLKIQQDKEDNGFQFYTDIFNYDKDNLICYDTVNKETAFVLISKQDGSITKEIKVPFEKKMLLMQTLMEDGEMKGVVTPGPYRSIIPCHDGSWILSEVSSDTIYTLLQDYSLHPFVVRTPPVQSMDPRVFLNLRLISDRFCFMETIKNVYDFNRDKGFPRTFMMYDNQEKAILNYAVYNGDYSIPKEIYMNATRPVNHEIESWYPLEAYRLVEHYNKGELKGKLKGIAEKLDEDDSPVIMLIKHRE